MIEILKGTQPNVISAKAMDTVDERDINELFSLIRSRLQENINLRLYLEMEKFLGWKPEELWKEQKPDLDNAQNMRQIAIVGARKWRSSIIEIFKPLSSSEIRFFEVYDKQEAIGWIEN